MAKTLTPAAEQALLRNIEETARVVATRTERGMAVPVGYLTSLRLAVAKLEGSMLSRGATSITPEAR